MSDELLTTAQKQLESIEKTLQRTRMLQTEGHKNLKELASTQESASTKAVPERHRRFPSIADTKVSLSLQCTTSDRPARSAVQQAWSSFACRLADDEELTRRTVPDTRHVH